MDHVRWALISLVLLVCAALGGAALWWTIDTVVFTAATPPPRPDAPNTPPQIKTSPAATSTALPTPKAPIPPKKTPPSSLGKILVAEDADLKKNDFWLEQPFTIVSPLPADGAALMRLYAGLDTNTHRNLSVTLRGGKAVLELQDAKDAPAKELGSAPLQALNAGDYFLGLQWRRGKVSVCLNERELISWDAGDERASIGALLGLDSAVQVFNADVRMGARRALAAKAIRFDDNFMRAGPNDDWHPQSGRWEMTAMTFAERSANPFSLRATFTGVEPFEDDPINGSNVRVRPPQYGIGVQISTQEGTPHIVRLTGGGPAAHAGLQEDDVFIEINGAMVQGMRPWEFYQLVNQMNGELKLKMYRPGEKDFREVTLSANAFKWGVSVEGLPIEPVRPPDTRGADRVATIFSGETGWSDYEVEVAAKPLGSGGFGVIVGATSAQDYLLFRWRGPANKGDPLTERHNRLELVRVKNGQETVLAQRAAHYRPYEFYRLGLDWTGNEVHALIDRNEIFSAKVDDLARGRIGLYAIEGEPVFFDDVHVTGDRSVSASWRQAERSLNSIFALEDDMEIWANPALEWERDLKTGWAIHNQRFPGEQALTISKPRFTDLQIALYCGAEPENSASPRLTIKGGVAQLSGMGLETQKLTLPPGPIQRLTFNAAPDGVHASIDGKKIAAGWIGDKPFLNSVAGLIARGGGEHLAIKGLKNLGDPAAVRVTSTGTLEYTFDNAPSDWKVASGRWGLLNKWICDPRWSWYGGRSKTVAAVWSKHIFSGDVTLDAHVSAMMMRDDQPYERPGDYNLTICGDGKNLDSGYTLICGGDLNSWTRLYRKGVLVAESTKEDFRITSDRIRNPDKADLHQRWFHLKLEKIDHTVAFYRDGKLAFKFNDPEPLPDGRVAFWTMDNGFLISRVRIAHGGARPAPFEDAQQAHFDDGKVLNVFDGETPTVVTRETLPEKIRAALALSPGDSKVAEFATLAAPADQAETKDPDAAYHIVNGIGGGAFALQCRSTLDIDAKGLIRFAYRIEPGAQIDFYLVGARADFNPRHQVCYRWRMSGPVENPHDILRDEFAPLVGDLPGVVADGKWHVLQYDLAPSFLRFNAKRGFTRGYRVPLRPMFGNLSNSGYLLAGMNGNHVGAAYSVSGLQTYAASETGRPAPSLQADPAPAENAVPTPLIIVHAGDSTPPNFDGLTRNTILTLPPPLNAAVRFENSDEAPPWSRAEARVSLETIATGELSGMGFRIPNLSWDTRSWPYLELDYRVPNEVPFNLHLGDEQGQEHSLALVKLEEKRDHTVQNMASFFGPPDDFITDNTWRTSTIPIARFFQEANPTARLPRIADLQFVDAGHHGGRRGLHYWIHRIQAVPAGTPEQLTFLIKTPDNSGVTSYESCVDGSPETVPAGKQEFSGQSEKLSDVLERTGRKLKDGWNYIHVRARNAAGVWSPVAHRKFFLDTTGPRVASTEPADGGTLASQTIRIQLADESGVDLAAIRLKVNDRDVTNFLELDAAKKTIVYDALLAEHPFAAGSRVKVALSGVTDQFGNLMKEPYTFSFKSAERTPHVGPEIQTFCVSTPSERSGIYRQYDMELSFGLDFEEHFGHVHAIRDCKMEWLDDRALSNGGQRCVRFTCLQDDGDVQIMLHKNAWNIDRYSLLHFDYKADPGFQVDLQLESFGVWYTIRFLGDGKAGDGIALGKIAETRADGTWHHGSVDMRGLLDAVNARLPSRIVDKIVLSAHGQEGCRAGAQLSLDNVDMAPASLTDTRNRRGDSNTFLRAAAKKTPEGLGGFSFFVDKDPLSDSPPERLSRSYYTPIRPRNGTWYAHARAMDQAGNWGPTKTILLEYGEDNGRQFVPDDDGN